MTWIFTQDCVKYWTYIYMGGISIRGEMNRGEICCWLCGGGEKRYASYEIWNAYDVSKYRGWFDSKLVCENCGKEFVGNCKTQRTICKDCWQAERKRKIAVAAKLCMRNKKFKQQS